MNDELRRHLDGELPRASLRDAHRSEADQWDRMVESFRTAAPRGDAPPWLEQKVMAEIEALPARGVLGRVVDWLVTPAPIRLSPLVAAGATLALALVLLVPGRFREPEPVEVAGDDPSVVFVQFVLDAPAATSVAIAGDFTEWEPSFTLEDLDGDGVWTGRVPVRPGVHTYMFLIDGNRWETDPRADRYRDDGFGNRNAVLAVAAGA